MSDYPVIRLVDRAPGFAVEDSTALTQWAAKWIEALASGNYGSIKSLVIVVESDHGNIAVLSQSTGNVDGARLAGLLFGAAHRKLDGRGKIEDLQK